jgi:hypothetical protein
MKGEKTVIDLVQFKLAKGVDEKTFLKLSDAAQTAFFDKADGHLGRELTRGEDGVWVDVIRWESLEKAEKASREFEKNPACQKLIQACDTDSMNVMRLKPVRVHEKIYA